MEFYLMLAMRDDLENGLESALFGKRKYVGIRLKVVVTAIPSV